MPNILNAEGLQLNTRDEWLAFWTEKFQAIYGTDINIDPDTPDGQFIGICVQVSLDGGDLINQVYNSFDPDNAIGVVLDQRVAINGVQRQAGTFSITPITIVITQPITLYGLDQVEGINPQPVYTIRDNEGNRWLLITTTSGGLLPGTYVLSFRAQNPGATLTTPNTITTQVTIVLGVQSVNNPSVQSSIGLDEEKDVELKVRRQQSVSQASQGYLAGLYAALRNINGLTSVFVYENETGATDADGVPSHSIWVIVSGTADPADIADAIYRKRNAGCGMFGDQTYNVPRPNQAPMTIRWDNVVSRTLFIKFTATSIDGIRAPNLSAIRPGLVTDYVPQVFEDVDINGMATVVQQIDPNTLVTNAGFSIGTNQGIAFSGVAASGTFKLRYSGIDTPAINWDDSAATIQTYIQALPTLNAALVTGSIASQLLTINLDNTGDVTSIFQVIDNTLQTLVPTPITVTSDLIYTPTFGPPSKRNQFRIIEENIYILAMQLLPVSSTVAATSGTIAFQGYGGYGTYTYSIQINNSGGSINASSGLYTAGPTPGLDTIKVSDAFGNFITATVTVV